MESGEIVGIVVSSVGVLDDFCCIFVSFLLQLLYCFARMYAWLVHFQKMRFNLRRIAL